VYCGNASSTKDHVFPKALFTAPLPPNMITVPACVACNQAKKECDTYFRDYLAVDMRSHGHETAWTQFVGPVLRSARRKQSEFLNHFKQAAILQRVATKSGIHLGQWAVAEVDGQRIDDEIRYIVRGLTHHHEKIFLSNQATISVQSWSADEMEVLWAATKKGNYVGPFEQGSDVCSWVYLPDGTGRFVWLFSFYGRWNFMAEVDPPSATK
jgi:hypothetical protein